MLHVSQRIAQDCLGRIGECLPVYFFLIECGGCPEDREVQVRRHYLLVAIGKCSNCLSGCNPAAGLHICSWPGMAVNGIQS